MGRFVVIEGLDGAGKRTLADGLTAELERRGVSVARIAFPRYDVDVHAELVRDALYGRLGDLAGSVYGMAVLFALDRRAAVTEIGALIGRHDVVLCDRYVASNAAYGAARLHQHASGEFVAWVRELEIDRFRLPVPDAQLLLRVPVTLASSRAAGRAAANAARATDAFESDGALQVRCAEVYEQLATASWLSRWLVLDGADTRPAAVLDQLLSG